jgi:(1->4)-alpha-D-glucan 1-alpha-D-glucosylmutase
MSEGGAAERAALDRLCALFGIDTEYHDVWGALHEVPEASLRALLGELGVDASTPRRASEAERTAQAARWRAVLPPFAAIPAEGSPWRVRVQLREAQAGSNLAWRIEEEGGARHEGAAEAGAQRELERAEIAGVRFVARELEIPVPLPMGYHRLVLRDPGRAKGILGETLLAAAPERCYLPAGLKDGARLWGPAVQLYGLRSERNWGIGDFGDLLQLIEQWSARGAAVIGLNPLHALFPHHPAHASPYSPSSRLALNVLYIDVEAVEEFRECEEARAHVRSPAFQERLARLREAPLVDYPCVAQAKFEVLERLYVHFHERHIRRRTPRALEFRDFQAQSGEQLRRHALYEALQEHFHSADPAVWGWLAWPEDYRDPGSSAVARFCAERIERVEYFEYLQWQTEQQLARAAARCESAGLALGLYLDLAVSVDRAGSDVWANQNCFALGASIGAPPDEYNLKGQDWGLPPLAPGPLRESRYELFAGTLREAMRHARALRIDHVMGLMRLYWIPPGASERDGAYVHYPLEELLAIVALESHRNRCVVIGEDLGTVPDAVRAALARAGALSYKVLYFERGTDGEFRAPDDYPRDALVCVSTHDLPTVAGWWAGRDLEWREKLALFPDEDRRKAQLAARAADRTRLARALERTGLLPRGEDPTPEALAAAVHAWLARAPALVMMVQLEDALGIAEQANLPGTVSEHPNWRRRLPCTLERMERDPRLDALGRAFAKERPHPARALRP